MADTVGEDEEEVCVWGRGGCVCVWGDVCCFSSGVLCVCVCVCVCVFFVYCTSECLFFIEGGIVCLCVYMCVRACVSVS